MVKAEDNSENDWDEYAEDDTPSQRMRKVLMKIGDSEKETNAVRSSSSIRFSIYY
jgi:hypothetical protein